MCCCGGWEPHLLPRSEWEEERKGERGATNLPTASHHLLSGKGFRWAPCLPSLRRAVSPSLPWKRNDISVAVAQPSGASWQCALSYVGESARENLDRRDAPESAYLDRDLFSEDWTWHTVGSPSGRKPVLHHHPKKPQTANQLRTIFLGQRSVICLKKIKNSDGRAMDAMSWILMQKVLDVDAFVRRWSLFLFDVKAPAEVWGWDTCLWDHRRTHLRSSITRHPRQLSLSFWLRYGHDCRILPGKVVRFGDSEVLSRRIWSEV